MVSGAAQNPRPSVLITKTYPDCAAPETIYIRNLGNAGANVTIATSPNDAYPFELGPLTPSETVGPGATVSHELSVVDGACNSNKTIEYVVTGSSICSLPLALSATFDITNTSSCYYCSPSR
jgi:hypothetical protein